MGVVYEAWQGSMDRLLGWLAGLGVDDVVISPPSLEDLFTAYYCEDSDEAGKNVVSASACEGVEP